MKAETLMVALRLSGERALVVGTTDEVADRAERLARAGARVVMVSPTPTGPMRSVAQATGAELVERAFADADLDACRLAILVDRDDALGERMARLCRTRGVLFCAIDQPYGDFAHVALVRRGPISIGISTDGEAPALARRLRQELSRVLDSDAFDGLVARLRELRARTERARRAKVLGDEARRLVLGPLSVAPPEDPDPH